MATKPEYLKALRIYNQVLTQKLEECNGRVAPAHHQALSLAGLTEDGLRHARRMFGLPNTAKPGTWEPSIKRKKPKRKSKK